MNREPRLGGGNWIPKRLVEAWVGALVKTRAPEALLWASTYRTTDGMGLAPQRDSILLQCSPAEDRMRGISTRVSRAMLRTYLDDQNLALWGYQTWFVLVGSEDDGSSDPSAPFLWGVPPIELAEVVDKQGRGTISAATLDGLAEAGAAVELGTLLQQKLPHESALRGSAPRTAHRAESIAWGGFIFGLNKPTPLGVAFGTSE